ncbi:Siderophore (Surfactin) biosynthesis regulatory protein [Geobacillus thermoleovorans CCB_US3_UF5]|uniref:Siderophore (Surfactin) biosynthesis regulatory protein n=1 Tax=Geobacillus thermoleovorans CCB_US3_UF5 TaxID=1111068 RepID=A0ABN4A0Z2_GEOTH|nr:Siderophore (Surfactin) biosynthesis regulatory protein [Geobacillus thermoleovorans CCB_US3_UF5]
MFFTGFQLLKICSFVLMKKYRVINSMDIAMLLNINSYWGRGTYRNKKRLLRMRNIKVTSV